MTIKDLCNRMPACTECSFAVLCPEYECPGDYDFYSEDNARITKAIIETSRKLLEDIE